MDGLIVYDQAAPLIQPGSCNAVSVTNAGVGLWDCVFAYVSRTADVDRFLVQAGMALGSVGFAGGVVTAIGASTITIRVATYSVDVDVGGTNKNILSSALSFYVSFKELG